MNVCYTLQGLRKLWDQYHRLVHPHLRPCDACAGDPCHATSFFEWLEKRSMRKDELMERIKPLREGC